MKPVLIACMACLLTLNAFTQNLVPNPSFEEYYSCPNSTGQVDSCVDWFSALNTPDYFSLCASYPVSVPDNVCGYQFPFESNSYMGLYTYHWAYFWREIIGAKLINPLVSGDTYHISMRVSRGNWTNMAYNCSASNKLGVRFSDIRHSSIDTAQINNSAHVYTDVIISDTLNWILLEWDYVADYPYKYIYIGNFFDDTQTDTTVINAPLGQFGTAYYYIDSVNVICVSESCITQIKNISNDDIGIVYNVQEAVIEINSAPVNSKISGCIFSFNGQRISCAETIDNTIDVSLLETGFYILRLQVEGDFYIKKIFIH